MGPSCLRRAVPLALMAATLSACSGGDDGRSSVTVLAAASLTTAFEDLEAAYERAHEDVDLVVSTGGSPSLAAQAAAGAPASVLITADMESMQPAGDAGVLAGEPASIATNAVTIATPTDAPGPVVDDAAGLADDDLLVALCAPEVPCGRAAEELLTAAGIDVEADSLELSVRGVVTRLGLREVDAGIVYRTDVAGSDGTLRAIATDAADTVGLVRYVAAPLEARPGGAELVEFLLGAEAQGILAEHGFGAP